MVSADNNLFSSGNDSDSGESKENGTPATPRQVPTGARIGGGGGLFEDEDEDDDFFGGKSLQKSASGKCGKISASQPLDPYHSKHCFLGGVLFFFSWTGENHTQENYRPV